ncbi:MAG: DUF2508 family protein [Ruminococcaceae bacterium]|nr:DUF2508 family protein [Oscillospiraceae bacterium]
MVSLEVIEKKGRKLLNRFRLLQENNQAKKLDEHRRIEFLRELRHAQNDLEAARNNYNFVKDTGLLEYYIYEIKAAETRVNYYLRLAKKENFRNEALPLGSRSFAGRSDELI